MPISKTLEEEECLRRLLFLKQSVAEYAPPVIETMRHQTTLKFIDAIARAGSIRRAAERMAITPSALNRRLLAVEEEIDAPLFERLATGVRLSAAGELFLAHARRQIADMERIHSQIEDMKGARRGHVSFGYDSSLNMESFAEAIGHYLDAHPDVTFQVERIDRNDIQRLLAEYRIDLACAIQPEAFPNLATLAVATADVCAVMHVTHPLSENETVSFNDLMPHPLVLPPSGSLRDILEAAARRQDYTLRPALECELPFARHVLKTSNAIGFSATSSVDSESPSHGMTTVPINQRDLANPNFHLVQLRGRALSVAASRFADRLVQRFAHIAGEI